MLDVPFCEERPQEGSEYLLSTYLFTKLECIRSFLTFWQCYNQRKNPDKWPKEQRKGNHTDKKKYSNFRQVFWAPKVTDAGAAAFAQL